MSKYAIKRIMQCLAAIMIAALLCVSILSHEGEEEKDEQATDTILSDSVRLAQDSIYAQINENYQGVRHIFENSCFDCHSKFTAYPWYYKIPGIQGMIDDDIKVALGHFDFTNDFPFTSKHSQLDLLNDIKDEIENNDMPLLSYRMMHWGKLIEGERRDSVFQWIDKSIELLKQNNLSQ